LSNSLLSRRVLSRLREGVFGQNLPAFAASLHKEGYSRGAFGVPYAPPIIPIFIFRIAIDVLWFREGDAYASLQQMGVSPKRFFGLPKAKPTARSQPFSATANLR
jgi:hypothetical protein